jgi:uncharacterized membrane protein
MTAARTQMPPQIHGRHGYVDEPPERSRAWPYLALLAFIGVLTPFRERWPVQLALVLLLLIVPGLILLRALRIPSRAVSSFPVYVPCASLMVLLISGLGVDFLAPSLGVVEPLRTVPLLAGFEVTCLVLLAASFRAPSSVSLPWRSLTLPVSLAWPMILPLIAAGGALRLNDGYGDAIALVALSLGVLGLIFALLMAPRLDNALLAMVLYAVSLALMWSFSLRGDLTYGFDIDSEYYALQQTIVTGIWHTSHPGDAYGAMLSVTVLPAQLHAMTGLTGLFVFKILYPAIGALLPVAVYGLARRVLSQRWAFAAAALLLVQASFFQELPGLARQEITLVLFAAVIAAMLDTELPRPARWTLVGVLSVAMALSHYSTAYMAIALFGVALPLQWLLSWIRRMPHVTGSVAIAFIATLVSAAVWYGPVTHSTSNVRQFEATLKSSGLELLPSQAGGLLSAYLRDGQSSSFTASQYAQQAHAYYAAHVPYVTPLPDASRPKYALKDSAPPAPPVRFPLAASGINLGELLVQQLVNLLALIGALMMVFRRRSAFLARQVGILTLASLLLLGLIRLSSTLAQLYNPERAFLQDLVVVAIGVFATIDSPAPEKRLRETFAAVVAAGALALTLAGGSGLTNAFVGGGEAVNLANTGEDYEHFYITTPEVAAAQWLGPLIRPGQLVYADRYGALRLAATVGAPQGLTLDVTPMTMNQSAWVYADRTNVVDDRASILFGSSTTTYVFPTLFLNQNFNVVYTNGSSEAYHR